MSSYKESQELSDLAPFMHQSIKQKNILELIHALNTEPVLDVEKQNQSLVMWIHQILVSLGLPVSLLSPSSINELINFMKRWQKMNEDSKNPGVVMEDYRPHIREAANIDFGKDAPEAIEAKLVEDMKRVYARLMQYAALKEKSATLANKSAVEKERVAKVSSVNKKQSLSFQQTKRNFTQAEKTTLPPKAK